MFVINRYRRVQITTYYNTNKFILNIYAYFKNHIFIEIFEYRGYLCKNEGKKLICYCYKIKDQYLRKPNNTALLHTVTLRFVRLKLCAEFRLKVFGTVRYGTVLTSIPASSPSLISWPFSCLVNTKDLQRSNRLINSFQQNRVLKRDPYTVSG